MKKFSFVIITLTSVFLVTSQAQAGRDTGWEPPGWYRKQLELERRERERLKMRQESLESKRAVRRKSGLVKSMAVKVMRFESKPDFLSGQMTATINLYGNGEYELSSLRIELHGELEASHDLTIDDLNKGYVERQDMPVLGKTEVISLSGNQKLDDNGGELQFRFVSDFNYGLSYGATKLVIRVDNRGVVSAAAAGVVFDEMVFGVRMRHIPFGPAGDVGVGIKAIQYRYQSLNTRIEKF